MTEVITNKLAAFSGHGTNMAQTLAHTVKENSAILRPFIETCADALAACYPDLYGSDESAMHGKKFDLLEALETETLQKQLADCPAVDGSLSTISQMTNFFLHMKTSGKGLDETEGVFKGTVADRAGLLSALAISCSASDAEFGSHAATAVKAAFYAGLAPQKVQQEWQEKGISFSRPRIPCLAGGSDLRKADDLNAELATLLSKTYDVDWKKVAEENQCKEVIGFGAEKPVLEQLRTAVESAGGKAEDWQLEAAGHGGCLWEAVNADEKKLLDELRKLPCGVALPDALFETYPSPGDLLKALKATDSSESKSDNREPWKWGDVNWAMVILMVITHSFAVWGALQWNHPLYTYFWTLAWIIYPLTGMLGITAGAHRLWSHKAYKAHFPARLVMMLANSVANQGSIFHWSRDHRVHHAKSDTEADPHDITRGFFYSHMGWLLLKKRQAVKDAGKKIDCSDLLQDPLVWIQHVCDPLWNQFFCFGLPTLFAWYAYDAPLLGFAILGAGRWLLCLHGTWTVNSVAHTFGDRPYTANMYPTESKFTTLVAVGEGYHNWHHTYPWDYSASELGCLNCYNPTTAWIDFLALIGQAYDRKRATHRKPKHC